MSWILCWEFRAALAWTVGYGLAAADRSPPLWQMLVTTAIGGLGIAAVEFIARERRR